MLKTDNDIDIINELGKVNSETSAKEVFKQYMDDEHLSRISKIKHSEVLKKIADAIVLCNPSKIFINTGSSDDRQFIKNLALAGKEESPLAMDGHTIHYDLAQEQGRVIDRTYYIANPEDLVSSLANRMDRPTALEEVRSNMTDIMKDMTMIVGFYMRGPVGSPVSNPALEITSSNYVAHSAELLYRNAYADFDKEVETLGHFFTNIHSQGLNRTQDLPDARVFMDRKYRTTYAWKCTYAGNTLLLKKGNHRFAVDKAVYENLGNELSEHMFITGIHGPNDRVTWFAGAAPSGCGKTTTAMAGNVFIGDDLAQMWIADDGSIRSVNPECGIFGIVEDVNLEGDPLLMKVLRQPGHEVIWSNVLIDENKIPHWVGNNEDHPGKGFNFQGEWYKGKTDDEGKPIPLSHPNSRCTLKSDSLENYSPEAENPEGALTRVFTYSGRDADTMPPVWVAKDPYAGVVIGACIVSAATATEVGATGIKRAPWANAPFIPGSLGDYMDAQFKFFGNDKIKKDYAPVMAGLNYFLTEKARGGESSRLLGEKKDVKVWLSWLERYAHNEIGYISTPIGNLPKYKDLQLLFKQIIDKEYSKDLYTKQFSLYLENIINRIELQKKAYAKEPGIPQTLFDILDKQEKALLALKDVHGSIVTPDILIN
ncbi:MAG: phosphoenolpyruvate carboxykinase (GTP) [Desulfobacula sp.]|jgi:phosphoenolpyruvate carboxykinase (GTP)|uniref:phosphoenolpyruvate carboxykinase (GTP) n=1 Tax=Desulfobacula sp. TaxID=2593537 RepID=UPI001E18C617|nr:phosphoenolpyruvate carboxykinase (GTP) [Desulfobacula sp.]MBT3484052.1 phosphoenolpyruvate carboxykinase (GTP) [Desulfobacula sp.]MBT3805127.1 phosphoenolpyruvate carboxykinase (GTP) [Desulfobacula sp.]MBT4026045.1 phosphoenolpyruvate carboxykinase (GTP) [Desulfobacula sp.]MBT4199802.1 phosphoenolpyruvate carboxykinase (GTP) [Desulfobacula sp.]